MQIFGQYQNTFYRDRISGFTIFTLKLSSHDEKGRKTYNCRGKIPFYAPNTPLGLEGEFIRDKDEDVFIVTESAINIHSRELLLSFMASCLPAGMGTVHAQRIMVLLEEEKTDLKSFLSGQEALNKISELKGFNRLKAACFFNKVNQEMDELYLMQELAPFGITYIQVKRLCEINGNRARMMLKENPYETLSMVNASFSSADMYAKIIGMDYCDSRRIEDLGTKTYYTLYATGHSYTDAEGIMRIFRRVEENFSAYEEQVPDILAVTELFSNRNGYVENINGEKRFYTKISYISETEIVGHLTRLQANSRNLICPADIENFIKNNATERDEDQKNAIRLLNNSQVSFLVGGPGSGKTTTIKDIVGCYEKFYPEEKILLMAPTGRAAKRMRSQTGKEAKTIHLWLEYMSRGTGPSPQKNHENPLEAGLIIVDEFSMVGICLFNQLLDAVPDGCKLLLVGDWNQLQSVEPGFLLHDLIDSGLFPYVRLTENHRQKNGSSIIENGIKILNGNIDLKNDDGTEIKRFANNSELKHYVSDIFKSYFDKNDLENFIIMSPKRGGALGTEELNRNFQGILHDSSDPYIIHGSNVFYEDDKIMTIKNHYDNPMYYNGDIWRLSGIIDADKICLMSDSEEVITLSPENYDDIELGYVNTVHKYQGSEGSLAVIILPGDIPNKMINRSLLYTAVTRARDKIVILSTGDMLEKFITSDIYTKRNSGIKEKLKKSNLLQLKL